MPGTWTHLAARFYDVTTSRALEKGERDAVRRWLPSKALREAFFAQTPADQRHGFTAALHIVAHHPDRPDLIRAALVHDIGKRHAALGPLGRVAASLAIRLRLPLTPRFALYRDHGKLGAAELAGEEADRGRVRPVPPRARPSTIGPVDWDVLVESDRARMRS
jgi:hypothetical protein